MKFLQKSLAFFKGNEYDNKYGQREKRPFLKERFLVDWKIG